jgi:peroxiredoxin
VWKRIVPVTVVILLLIGLAIVPAFALLPPGQQAPDFTLADLSNKMHSLSDYRGKVVVIDFFGADCGPCKTSATNDLVPLYNNYYQGDARVQFLSVEITGATATYTSTNFVTPTGITWPVLVGGTASSYGIAVTPTVYVIDSTGKVALAMPYPVNVQTLKSTIDQSVSGQGWGAWSAVGGQLTSGTGPAACTQGANSLDVFVQGTDRALWYKHWDGTSWGTWKSLGGVLTSDPAAVSRPNGKIDVFVRGTDGALWSRYTTDGGTTWSTWYKIGGQLLAGTGPAAYAWGGAQIGWLVTGTNKALYHMWKDSAGTHSWENLGGVLTSSPAATAPTTGVIDVYGRGSNGALYQKEYSSTAWGSSWTSLGGQLASGTGPAACSWGAGRLEVFVQGTNGALYHRGYTGTWSGWENLGGKLASSPAAATASGSSRIDVYGRGTDGALWQRTYLKTV